MNFEMIWMVISMQRVSYGAIIRNLRTRKDLTQTELGDMVGVDKTTISAYELDKIMPPVEVFYLICKATNTEIMFKTDKKSYTMEELSKEVWWK